MEQKTINTEPEVEPEVERYKVIATKVSTAFYKIFKRICRKKDMKTYEVVQIMVETFVRYTDDRHNLSAEMERLMTTFEHMEGWKDCFNLADVSETEKEIETAIYIMRARGKNGERVVMVNRPWMQSWFESYNVRDIMERVFEAIMPERYMRMRILTGELGFEHILDLLDYFIDLHSKDSDIATFRQLFEDSARADNAKPVEYGQKRKSTHHRDIDGAAAQKIINFTNEPEIDNNNDTETY